MATVITTNRQYHVHFFPDDCLRLSLDTFWSDSGRRVGCKTDRQDWNSEEAGRVRINAPKVGAGRCARRNFVISNEPWRPATAVYSIHTYKNSLVIVETCKKNPTINVSRLKYITRWAKLYSRPLRSDFPRRWNAWTSCKKYLTSSYEFKDNAIRRLLNWLTQARLVRTAQ